MEFIMLLQKRAEDHCPSKMQKLLFFLIPFLVLSFILFVQPSYAVVGHDNRESHESLSRKFSSHRLLLSHESEKYAVILDAGSTGTRVRVFRFDSNSNLLRIGQDFEFYLAVKPGLSSYASDPKAAAESIKPLLEKAEANVPKEFQSHTPVKVGATAGLRLLKGDAPEKILEAVRDMIRKESPFKYKAEWITVIDGTQEGAYLWMTINYLLGRAGKMFSKTVATVEIGGASMQMTYGISDESASRASTLTSGGEKDVQERTVMGTKYHLYAHSYLNYGLFAARAEILKISRNSSHPCILSGYHGSYIYNGQVYKASSLPSGSSLKKCRAFVLKALKINAPCIHRNCTFNGVWNGGGGAGQKNLYAASFFYDIAISVGVIPQGVVSAVVFPKDYFAAAKRACVTEYKNVKYTFPNIDERDAPFVCLDLLYEYTVLVNGFGLKPCKKITLVKRIKYRDSLVDATWPLGSAIDAISSRT